MTYGKSAWCHASGRRGWRNGGGSLLARLVRMHQALEEQSERHVAGVFVVRLRPFSLLRAEGRVRACVCVVGGKRKNGFPPLVRHLAGLGGPWRPKKDTQTTTGLP